MFYQLDRVGCPKGYSYVRDYMGNRVYYGPISDCLEFITIMERELENE